jgi:predicted HAD superfamily Cof-like phosphohydrolase
MNFHQVRDMRAKFQLPNPISPDYVRFADDEWLDFRHTLLMEEVDEVRVAGNAGDLTEMLDGLLDTVVIAMGTAAGLGLDWNPAFDEVMRSNMAKEPSKNGGADTKRNHTLDLVKPPGWVGPQLERFTDPACSGITITPLEEAAMLRKRKEADYQRSDITKADYFPFGIISHVQMINLKVVRLRSLISTGDTPANEAMEDTLVDLINYASFALEHLRGVEGV